MNAIDAQRARVGASDVIASIAAATNEFYGRMSGRVRNLLKHYTSEDLVSFLGMIAGVSLLSNGWFRLEDLWAGAASRGGAERAESVVADLVGIGLLIESKTEGARSFRFSEDGLAAYLWLQASAVKLRAEQRPAAANGAAVALAQGKKQN
jgi:hypothetical protein